jgi:hypothetical protein
MQATYGLYTNELTDLCNLIVEAGRHRGKVLISADEGEAFMKLVAIDATHATFGYTEGLFSSGGSGHMCSFKHFESRVPLALLKSRRYCSLAAIFVKLPRNTVRSMEKSTRKADGR